LELGNNSAVVVRADADLDLAVPACVAGAYAHSGQTCISVQRIFVEAAVHGEFVERFAALAARLKRGHPLTEDTDISSLIEDKEAERVEAWVEEAISAGASKVMGGYRDGARLAPIALTNVTDDARLMRMEAFGPVAAINAVADLDEAIARVNDSRYGLQTGIFTRDLTAAFRFAREVESGGVLINDVSNFRVDHMPYGGVKESGAGREGPRYAIEEMTETKLISWRV
jgi:acyl-CoA reductase-like NAD-dependent aldehyde dehydrogenase